MLSQAGDKQHSTKGREKSHTGLCQERRKKMGERNFSFFLIWGEMSAQRSDCLTEWFLVFKSLQRGSCVSLSAK